MSNDRSADASDGPDGLDPEDYRAMFDLVNDAIFVHDAETGAILDVNDTMCEMYGYDRAEALDLSIGDVSAGYPPYTEARAQERIRKAVAGEPQVFEWHAADADGEQFWVEVSLRHAVLGGDGRVLVIVRDIEERKKRERRLRYYETAIEQSNDVMAAVDTDGRYLFVNEAWGDHHEQSADAVVGRPVSAVLDRETYDRVEPYLERAMRGEAVEFEVAHETPDGRPRRFVVEYYPFDPGRGGEEAVVAIMTDITDRLERERELSEKQERLALALETANAGIWAWERETDEATWDENLEQLFGLDPGTFEGTFEAFLDRVHPDDRAAVERTVEQTAERGGSFNQEFRIVREDDVVRWLASRGKAFDAGTPDARMVGVEIDITERKERERHLRVIDRVLRHNLRNDTNIIRGLATNIQRATDGRPSADADRILECAGRLLETAEKEREIVDVLLGGHRTTTFDANEVARTVVQTIHRDHPEATLELDLSESVTVDALKGLPRAIRELVENAVVHSDAETPSVRVAVTADEEAVRFHVADEGPGIPEMERAVLTGDREVRPLYHGSGLGLWLVNWTVRLSDGTVRIDENEPRGTVITVRLPRSGTGSDDW
ncbi:PAS domain-containing protein [Haloplanus aerogenes]|uniref:histidine kinase n=1 Tax=Haloplanus aerogenes TaxID=660522 RepID=A0A3M0DSJ6_9EURY|nr:PAS domain S-box protein [Haloplanus aerogenes]AZH25377.1 PAS domain S-box protein [Haloplanus aerogenes]RMB25079.1 PAS domain S-box-containing protein [Haloplanus aerogenes]